MAPRAKAHWAGKVVGAGLLASSGCTDLFGFQWATSEVECLQDSDCPVNLVCMSRTCVGADAGPEGGMDDASADARLHDAAKPDAEPIDDAASAMDLQLPPSSDSGSEGSLDDATSDAGCSHLVLFGGATESGVLGDTWIWDGVSWSQGDVDAGDPDSSAPPGRQGAAMSSTCGLAVLAGGLGIEDGGTGIALADAWQWNGATWLPSAAPPSRNYAAAATLGTTAVLFGGEHSLLDTQFAKGDL